MSGWKTWLAVAASLGYGVGVEGLINGDWLSAKDYIFYALALLGIGGKLSKLERKF